MGEVMRFLLFILLFFVGGFAMAAEATNPAKAEEKPKAVINISTMTIEASNGANNNEVIVYKDGKQLNPDEAQKFMKDMQARQEAIDQRFAEMDHQMNQWLQKLKSDFDPWRSNSHPPFSDFMFPMMRPIIVVVPQSVIQNKADVANTKHTEASALQKTK
jgi:hypothetical protein